MSHGFTQRWRQVKAYDFSPIVSIWQSTEGRSSQTFALMLRALYKTMSEYSD